MTLNAPQLPALVLAPPPKSIQYRNSNFVLPEKLRIATVDEAANAFKLLAEGRILADGQKLVDVKHQDLVWHTRIGMYRHDESAETAIQFQVVSDPTELDRPGAYKLIIDGAAYVPITIIGRAGDAESFWNGAVTLHQILMQIDDDTRLVPDLEITDYPDFARRGVMIDISRDKVPTLRELFGIVARLSYLKINEFQLYTEHTFAYEEHRGVWQYASPMTGSEIRELDAFCKTCCVDLVPNQNSFGHFHRWLMHEQYVHLAEDPAGVEWSFMLTTPRPFSLSPAVPEVIPFIAELYDELLPNFTSKYFNVGCDETADLGKNRSKQLVAEQGTGRVYLNFVKQLASLVHKHGKTMQFWGDIIIDYPELVKELPQDIIALEWGYEADHPFEAHSKIFAESGIPFYVCPGTSSWLSLLGRTDNAIGNLDNAAINGKRNGALGYLITEWGDYGHHQPLSANYLGYTYGACRAWDAEVLISREQLVAMLNHFAFEDNQNVMGDLAYDLGMVYKEFSNYVNRNASVVVRSLYFPMKDLATKPMPGQGQQLHIGDAEIAQLHRMIARFDELEQRLKGAGTNLNFEYSVAIRLFRHACKRLLLLPLLGDESKQAEVQTTVKALAAEIRYLIGLYAKAWLNHNQVGGLGDSLTRFTRILAEYEAITEIRSSADARRTS